MRTKTLLLTAAVIAVGITASQAQVYSVNAVGYVNLNVIHGFQAIANPLNGTNNSLNTILPNVADGTAVYKFNPVTQSYSAPTTFFFDPDTQTGLWFPDATLNPGEGVFLFSPVAATLTFVGEVPQGSLTNTIPGHFSLRSSIVPQSGGLSSALGFSAVDGDTVYFFNPATQSWLAPLTFFFDPDTQTGVWFPSEPTPAVGQAFFISNGAGNTARNWTRSFSVNN